MSNLSMSRSGLARVIAERWARMPVRAVTLVLFLFSGFSALTYEVTWVRMLSLSFGVSMVAVTAVLTAFMGGLALGSWWWGRTVLRGSPLRVYSLLQLGVAVAACLSPWVVDLLTMVYVQIFNQFQPNYYVFNLIRFVLAALVLIVPATLMGGSFPVISQFLADDNRRHGSDLGLLYAINTFGSVLGTFLTGLVLIRVLGVHATLFLAAGIDLVVALVAWSFARTLTADAEVHERLEHVAEPAASRQRSRRALKQMAAQQAAAVAAKPTAVQQRAEQRERTAIIWAFGLSGFVALGYEVVWTRLIAIFTLNTIFSFTIMLTTFLIGLALGSAVVRRSADRWKQPFLVFAYLQLLIGLASVLMLFVFAKLPTILPALVSVVSFGSAVAAEFVAAGVTMLVPTLLLGATFPVAARVYAGQDEDVGRRMGRLYGVNTVGSMLGSVVAGFGLIPLLGLQWSCLALAGINIVLGLGMMAVSGTRPRWAVASVALVAVVAAALLPPGIYLGFREGAIPELAFYREGMDATVSVFEVKQPPLKISFVNGRSEVPTDRDSMRAFYLLGNLPPLLNPDAQSALMVSFGNGIASGTMARHRIPHIQAVEIVAEQVEAARLYQQENRDILDNPNFNVTIEDGRNYLLRSREAFDIITADATHPISTSSWALFTREFYHLVHQRLAPDGVFVQWLPFHDLKEADYRSIVATFQQEFPHTTLWFTGGTHTFLVATPDTLTHEQVLALQSLMEQRGVTDDLVSAQRLNEDFLLDETQVKAYVANASIISDDRAFFVPAQNTEMILDSFLPFAKPTTP